MIPVLPATGVKDLDFCLYEISRREAEEGYREV
jgi:hypothetical protein